MASSPAGHGSASHPKRDPDLLIPDDILTDTHFDNLWDWFASALETNMDRQFIFAKLVNSVRKPYLNQSHLHLTGTSYTPSECTVTDDTSGESQPHEDENSAGLNSQIEGLKLQFRGVAADLAKKGKDIRLLKTKFDAVSPVSAPRVAIMSADMPGNFVRMAGSQVYSHKPNGSGNVSVQPHILGDEIFQLEYYPDGVIAFKATSYQNVYLHASCNPLDLAPGDTKAGGGGVVNCQYISEGPGHCSVEEKFRIYPLRGPCGVAIEPVAFPGRYLSLDAEKKTVSLQGVRGKQESLYLIFVTF
ncbi:hypothetical protein BDZ91DRAFT_734981 [Kalaharituber pfeilii]|nr:hypothetical protein BDZ91DRAFT_734981 [Kalaharituber pfeilii]